MVIANMLTSLYDVLIAKLVEAERGIKQMASASNPEAQPNFVRFILQS